MKNKKIIGLANGTDPQDSCTMQNLETELNYYLRRDGINQATGNLDMANNLIQNVANPQSSSEVCNKAYVDSLKPLISVHVEENGPLTAGNLEWRFGNGTENVANYGFCLPVSGRVKHASLTASANGSPAGEIRVNLVINGTENTDYEITKPENQWSDVVTFETPLELNAGDRLNFI